jgi:hypothetical protein
MSGVIVVPLATATTRGARKPVEVPVPPDVVGSGVVNDAALAVKVPVIARAPVDGLNV